MKKTGMSLQLNGLGPKFHNPMKKQISIIFTGLLAVCMACAQKPDAVQLKVLKDQSRVEVYMDGEFFTAYRYESTLEKPILYPVLAPSGAAVTRGFPLDPRPNERVDHPHQVGFWFNYGDVNGFDFWNNSYAVPAEEKGHYGRIIHRGIETAESGPGKGVLIVKMDWMAPDAEQAERLLEEQTTYLFSNKEGMRIIDRITTLTATANRVVFTDNKEGMLAIRVDRAFEQPDKSPVLLTDASGQPGKEAVINTQGVNGWYLNSEGDEGDDAWGKNARWVRLTGTRADTTCSLVLMDHPDNINYPSCWHARGYGLFAVNNLGRQVYNPELDTFVLELEKGESLTLKHRLVIAEGTLSPGEIEALSREFGSE